MLSLSAPLPRETNCLRFTLWKPTQNPAVNYCVLKPWGAQLSLLRIKGGRLKAGTQLGWQQPADKKHYISPLSLTQPVHKHVDHVALHCECCAREGCTLQSEYHCFHSESILKACTQPAPSKAGTWFSGALKES